MWLNSPWANSNKTLIALFQKLKPYYPDFNSGKLTKEKLFKKVLPKGKYSASRINNMLSEGFHAAEEFLVFQNLRKDNDLKQNLLTKELQERHLEDWFFKTIDNEIERLQNKEPKEWEEHFDLLQLHRRYYHHPSASTRIRPGGQTIIEMDKGIELVYLLEKATIVNEKIFRNRILKNESHEVEVDLKEWLNKAKNVNHPSIKLYELRFQPNVENLLDWHLNLRSCFFEVAERLNVQDLRVHLFSLINDHSVLYRKGLVGFSECLPLYKYGLEREVLLKAGIMTRVTFSTIVVASNANKDFEYTQYFIDKYLERLDPKIQSDANIWAKSHTLYRRGEFEQCTNLLLTYSFKVSNFQLISKVLNAQAYFDLFLKQDAYQGYLVNYLDTFEKWIQREKFGSNNIKKSYLRFIQITRQFVRIFTDVEFDPNKFKFLEKEKNVQAAAWLREKAKELTNLRMKKS